MSDFIPTKRQAAILKMLTEDGFVATDDMVSRFQVTPQTIRRDLNELNALGLITRFHGGAGQARTPGNRPYKDRLQTRVEAKQQIAKSVVSLIPNGASLFLNSGTTIEAVARELLSRENLSVVTNNINVAQILSNNETFEIMIAGGQVRNVDGAIIGPTSIEFIEQFHMDFGVIGTNSIDEDGTLWDFDQLEVHNSRATISNSDQVILVADQHKFGRKARSRMGHISDVDMLVTDRSLDSEFSKLFRNADVDVYGPEADE